MKRAYLRDPAKSIPGRTLRRLKDASSEAMEETTSPVAKQRRLYLRDPTHLVPRQTIWIQKKGRQPNDSQVHGSEDTLSSGEDEFFSLSSSEDSLAGTSGGENGPLNLDGGDSPLNVSNGNNSLNLSNGDNPLNSSGSESPLNSSHGDISLNLSDSNNPDSPLNLSDTNNSSNMRNADNPLNSSGSEGDPLNLNGSENAPFDFGGGDCSPLNASRVSSNFDDGLNLSSDGDNSCLNDSSDDPFSSSTDWDEPFNSSGDSNDSFISGGASQSDNEQTAPEPIVPKPEPLYSGAPITPSKSQQLINQFATSNRLSYAATEQLLDLIRSHCPDPNLCCPTVHKLKKGLGEVDGCVYTRYCSICMNAILPPEKKCYRMGCEKTQTCHFALLPFEDHLSDIFSNNWTEVQYPFTRHAVRGCIQDIHDGKHYLKLSGPGNFFSVPERTGLILCADGVPLFKSSGQSLWPVQLAISSLPPIMRMDFRYLLLAGVWLGNVKPDMTVIMQPILDKIHHLYSDGIQITTPDGPRVLKAMLLTCVFDLPAKAMTINFTQWNGQYGCSYCLDFGTQRAHRRLYLPSEKHEPRSDKDVADYASQAVSSNAPVKGVKGYSVLSPYLNIIKDVAIDYMHAVLEGVAKTLISKIWMQGQHRNLRFYLWTSVKEIDRHLLAIKPPHEFRRSPRCIETTIKYWKASELRAFLLFYAIPILIDFLPIDYVHHLNLLVKSIHILLSTNIRSTDLKNAELMLKTFYQTIPYLYPLELCTINVHSLIHICDSVRRCGPLWSFSCFGFESMNGHLKKHCHGTRNVLPQLVRNVRFHQNGQQRNTDASNGVHGRVKYIALQPEYVTALEEGQFPITRSTLPVFRRYKLNNIVYQVWSDGRLRNSSTCKFQRANGTAAFGSIRCFCMCAKLPIAIIATFSSVKDAFDGQHPANFQELNEYSLTNSCIFQAEKLSASSNVVAVRASSIMVKCVHIPSQLVDYIVPLPNMIEHH